MPGAQEVTGSTARAAVSLDDYQERANKWVVLALAAVGAFMTTLDASIVNISLPSIAHSFGVPLSGAIEWIIIGYLVIIAAVLLTFGCLADMIGRKPIWLAGLTIFTIGSALSGAAPSLGILIAARLFQGLGGALILGLSFGQEWGWTSLPLLLSLVIGVVALIAAVLVEGHVKDPVLHLSLLRNRVFASANISFILAMLALFAPGFLLPFYLEELRGYSAEQAGLLLTPLPLTLAVVAPISGRSADRIGSRWLAPLWLAMALLGLILLSQLNAQSSTWDVIWRLIVIGIGQGIFQSPNSSAMMGAAPRNEH